MATQTGGPAVSPGSFDQPLGKIEEAFGAVVHAVNQVNESMQLIETTFGQPAVTNDGISPAGACFREAQIALARAEEVLSALMKGLATGDWKATTQASSPEPGRAKLVRPELKTRIVVAEEPSTVQRGLLKLPKFLRANPPS